MVHFLKKTSLAYKRGQHIFSSKEKDMKNGHDQKFIVKKSFIIGNQIVVMEGDVLQYIQTERIEGFKSRNDEVLVDIYFEAVNSFWCMGMEFNLTPQQVAEYLVYKSKVY